MAARNRIELNVEGADHEVVGALGAFWDPQTQSWFVDHRVRLELFAAWLPAELQLETVGDANDSVPKGVALSTFLTRVRDVIRSAISEATWVRAEIRKIQKARSGHIYLELEERDAEGQAIAHTAAIIWANRAQAIFNKFAKGTSDQLKPDIKVLLQVRTEFHSVHGFSLIIEDVDPSFTLGDLLAQLKMMRETLKAESVYEQNKRLQAPLDFVRVAVVCPASSAGQGDFRSEADSLDRAGLCVFDYFTATFQGPETSQSIRDAVRAAYEAHQQKPYDALAIIRGGGSVTDLAWLNDLKLSRWLCRLPIPVFTGIGHERDSTILDEIAHRRFDTPSKVALHIAHTIGDNAWEAIKSLERIRTQVSRIASHQQTVLSGQRQRLAEQTSRVLEKTRAEVTGWDAEIRSTSNHQLRETALALSYLWQRLGEGANDAHCSGELGVQRNLDDINHRSTIRIRTMAANLDRLSQSILHRAQSDAATADAGMNRLAQTVAHRSHAHAAELTADTERLFQLLVLASRKLLENADRNLDHQRSGLESECEHWIAVMTTELQNAVAMIRAGTTSIQKSAGAQVEAYARTIVGMGPDSTLQRGYAIARGPEGSPVSSKKDAMNHKDLVVQFRDGALDVENREYGRSFDA